MEVDLHSIEPEKKELLHSFNELFIISKYENRRGTCKGSVVFFLSIWFIRHIFDFLGNFGQQLQCLRSCMFSQLCLVFYSLDRKCWVFSVHLLLGFSEVHMSLSFQKSVLPLHECMTFGGVTMSGLIDFNKTEVDGSVSSNRLRAELRSYVGNVYSYHRQYIYDVVLYQYQQDRFPTVGHNRDHFKNVLAEILGDAQQVKLSM